MGSLTARNGKSPSRFSDPSRRVADNRFGVLYFGDSLKVCFLETVLRNRREGLVDDSSDR
ncbi:RES domain-containing protein [Mesorhizobium mediterraneum]|uniref:RES domain-containing protein n=1 Tax=Mesorhizobium mediterraneum TaxID=43617 RepID=UPI0032B821C7